MPSVVHEADVKLLRSAIALARRSREHGNHPFGALLASPDGQVLLEAENTVVTGAGLHRARRDPRSVMRLASRQYSPEFLAGCSLYTSTEPCPMCSGAIFWGGVGRVVFALGQPGFYGVVGEGGDGLRLPCRDVFTRGNRAIQVLGPALEDEALEVHRGFWV